MYVIKKKKKKTLQKLQSSCWSAVFTWALKSLLEHHHAKYLIDNLFLMTESGAEDEWISTLLLPPVPHVRAHTPWPSAACWTLFIYFTNKSNSQ